MKILEKLTMFTAMFLIGGLLMLDDGGAAVARALRFSGGSQAPVTTEILVILSVATAICAVLRLLGQASPQNVD